LIFIKKNTELLKKTKISIIFYLMENHTQNYF